MRAAFTGSYANATDLADYLVAKGVAFRDAHAQVGSLVQQAVAEGKELETLSLETIQASCPDADENVYKVLALETIVAARTSRGGTAPVEVAKQIALQRSWLSGL